MAIRGFNGAADFCIRGNTSLRTTRSTSRSAFNGAADFHPRKRALIDAARRRTSRLQWVIADFHPRKRPLPLRDRQLGGFNGAADFHPRKPMTSNAPVDDRHASMGPRTSIRGNCSALGPFYALVPPASMGPRTSIRGNFYKTPMPIYGSDYELQWGRGLPSAETPGMVGEGLQRVLASMGPRTSIRGNMKRTPVPSRTGLASMGPRTSIRGNLAPRTSGSGSARFNGAADFHPRKLCAVRSGPNFTTVSFNGAADFHPRKRRDVVRLVTPFFASMGPRTSIRGNRMGSKYLVVKDLHDLLRAPAPEPSAGTGKY